MASNRPLPRERAITPLTAFDDRPKVAGGSEPVIPFDSAPFIPLAPRVATGMSHEPHDTDHEELQDAELGDDDKTPADPETPYEMILRKLTKLERTVKDTKIGGQRCYQSLLELHTKIDTEQKERLKLADRMLALELANRWVPRIAWAVTTAIAVLALLRTYR